MHALVEKNNEVIRALFIYMKMMAEVFFKEIRFIFVLTMCICQCAGICMRVPMETRLQILLDLEQAAVSGVGWVLGIELGSSVSAVCALDSFCSVLF